MSGPPGARGDRLTHEGGRLSAEIHGAWPGVLFSTPTAPYSLASSALLTISSSSLASRCARSTMSLPASL